MPNKLTDEQLDELLKQKPNNRAWRRSAKYKREFLKYEHAKGTLKSFTRVHAGSVWSGGRIQGPVYARRPKAAS